MRHRKQAKRNYALYLGDATMDRVEELSIARDTSRSAMAEELLNSAMAQLEGEPSK